MSEAVLVEAQKLMRGGGEHFVAGLALLLINKVLVTKSIFNYNTLLMTRTFDLNIDQRLYLTDASSYTPLNLV